MVAALLRTVYELLIQKYVYLEEKLYELLISREHHWTWKEYAS